MSGCWRTTASSSSCSSSAGRCRDGAAFAEAFPEIPMVLAHCGMPEDLRPAGRAAWRAGMTRLAAVPGVSVKLSGLGTFIHRLDAAHVERTVRETVALFGPERCLWGSNFPIEKLWTGYASLIDAYRRALAHLSAADRAASVRRQPRAGSTGSEPGPRRRRRNEERGRSDHDDRTRADAPCGRAVPRPLVQLPAPRQPGLHRRPRRRGRGLQRACRGRSGRADAHRLPQYPALSGGGGRQPRRCGADAGVPAESRTRPAGLPRGPPRVLQR